MGNRKHVEIVGMWLVDDGCASRYGGRAGGLDGGWVDGQHTELQLIFAKVCGEVNGTKRVTLLLVKSLRLGPAQAKVHSDRGLLHSIFGW